MKWENLTDREKHLDRCIGNCGIKLDNSTSCLRKVLVSIGASPSEETFVKERINLRLKTASLLAGSDDFISKTEKMLADFEVEDKEWEEKGRRLGIKL